MNPNIRKPCLEVKNLSFSYADEPDKIVLDKLSFEIKIGEIVGIVGPNGCGKTTILNIVSDFLKPTRGEVIRHNSEKQKIFLSLVFQEPALLDWKTVNKNIELSLLSNLKIESQRQTIIKQMITLFNLEPYKDKLPKQLSGGLKQRVAIARALAPNPLLLLMDEPFSALDIGAKVDLMKDIREIILNQNKSAIFITHNIEEALFFCDSIILLNPKIKNIDKILRVPLPKKRKWDNLSDPSLKRYKRDLQNRISKSFSN